MTVERHENLLNELRADVTRLYDRHLENERTWYPHEQIEWGEGTSFRERPWSKSDYDVADGVRSAIYVNLLTEDNLPYYTQTLMSHTPADHPLHDWNHQWTMEENRHSMIMRDWVHISRCIDPTMLEDGRRVQMHRGEVPTPDSLADLIAYVAFQERATQIAHRNTGAKLPKDDKMGRTVLATIAGDETKHYVFYRDLSLAAFAVDPSLMMAATARQLTRFAMPGTGIPGFTRHAVRIAREGIYGLGQFLNDVVEPVTTAWNLEGMKGLSADGERAREQIRGFVDAATTTVNRMLEKQASISPRLA